jgi:hypothetical protein
LRHPSGQLAGHSGRREYRFEVRQAQVKNKDNLVILPFSGGGTRAAAFSYGVLGHEGCGAVHGALDAMHEGPSCHGVAVIDKFPTKE